MSFTITVCDSCLLIFHRCVTYNFSRATVAESQLAEREAVLARLKDSHRAERHASERERAELSGELEKLKLEWKCNIVTSDERLNEARNTIEQ